MAAAQLPSLKDIDKLSPRVIRILGGNPGKFTLQGTNTYLIGTGRERILIDAAHGYEAWAKSLSTVLAAERATVSTCLLTHWHPDHVLGVPDLLEICPGVKIYKHKSSVPSLVEITQKSTEPARGDQSREDDVSGILEIKDGQTFTTEGAKLTAIHSPGHTDDHVAFLLEDADSQEPTQNADIPATAVRISDSGSVFAGDNVLGHGTTVFEDLALYLSSLAKMRQALHSSGVMYPAHGEIIKDGRSRIDEYVKHRKDREDQVVAVLSGDREEEPGTRAAPGSWTSNEITRVVYKGVDDGLLEAAERGINMILTKLEGESRVRRSEGRWWIVDKARF